MILSLFPLDVRGDGGDGGDGGDENDVCSEFLILICNLCQLTVSFTGLHSTDFYPFSPKQNGLRSVLRDYFMLLSVLNSTHSQSKVHKK